MATANYFKFSEFTISAAPSAWKTCSAPFFHMSNCPFCFKNLLWTFVSSLTLPRCLIWISCLLLFHSSFPFPSGCRYSIQNKCLYHGHFTQHELLGMSKSEQVLPPFRARQVMLVLAMVAQRCHVQSLTVNKDFFPQRQAARLLGISPGKEREGQADSIRCWEWEGTARRDFGRRFAWCPSASTLGEAQATRQEISLRTTEGWLRISRLKWVEDSGTRSSLHRGLSLLPSLLLPCAFWEVSGPCISRVLTDPCLKTMRFGSSKGWGELRSLSHL